MRDDGDESALPDYWLEKQFDADPGRTPVPVKGDQLWVDGFLLTVRHRCITVRSAPDMRPSAEDVELITTIHYRTFVELEATDGWARE